MSGSRASALYPTVTLDGWLPNSALSPNARVHWRVKAKAAAEARSTVWGAVMHAGWPRTPALTKKRLVVTLVKRRLLDGDNATSLCKSICDGVVDTGVVVDDSLQYLEVVVKQEKGKPCTRIELLEATDVPTP